jgi:hypothetical protein
VQTNGRETEISEHQSELLRVGAGVGENNDGLSGELVEHIGEVALLVLEGEKDIVLKEGRDRCVSRKNEGE